MLLLQQVNEDRSQHLFVEISLTAASSQCLLVAGTEVLFVCPDQQQQHLEASKKCELLEPTPDSWGRKWEVGAANLEQTQVSKPQSTGPDPHKSSLRAINTIQRVSQTCFIAHIRMLSTKRIIFIKKTPQHSSSIGKNCLIWIKRNRLIFFSLKKKLWYLLCAPGSSAHTDATLAWSSPLSKVPV